MFPSQNVTDQCTVEIVTLSPKEAGTLPSQAIGCGEFPFKEIVIGSKTHPQTAAVTAEPLPPIGSQPPSTLWNATGGTGVGVTVGLGVRVGLGVAVAVTVAVGVAVAVGVGVAGSVGVSWQERTARHASANANPPSRGQKGELRYEGISPVVGSVRVPFHR